MGSIIEITSVGYNLRKARQLKLSFYQKNGQLKPTPLQNEIITSNDESFRFTFDQTSNIGYGKTFKFNIQTILFGFRKGLTKNEVFSQKEKFLSILDGYVEKGLCVKKKINNNLVQYEDSSTTGKYKGRILFNTKTNSGTWETHIYQSVPDLKRLASTLNLSSERLVELMSTILDETYKNILSDYYKIVRKNSINNTEHEF